MYSQGYVHWRTHPHRSWSEALPRYTGTTNTGTLTAGCCSGLRRAWVRGFRVRTGNRLAVSLVYTGLVSDVTRILDRVQQGEAKAAEELLPLVYEELRKLATHKLAGEAPGQTLQPTALVHEAWLKLAGSGREQFAGRSHFLAAAAEAMRRILIDRARFRQRPCHGGGQQRVALDGIELAAPQSEERLLEVDEAIDRLAAEDPVRASVVKLRFFVGLSDRETAEALGLSERTVERHWAYAKAWLFRAIRKRKGT
jgi:RNA polymerase sigma factor (TIGR02999 family)